MFLYQSTTIFTKITEQVRLLFSMFFSGIFRVELNEVFDTNFSDCQPYLFKFSRPTTKGSKFILKIPSNIYFQHLICHHWTKDFDYLRILQHSHFFLQVGSAGLSPQAASLHGILGVISATVRLFAAVNAAFSIVYFDCKYACTSARLTSLWNFLDQGLFSFLSFFSSDFLALTTSSYFSQFVTSSPNLVNQTLSISRCSVRVRRRSSSPRTLSSAVACCFC